MSLPIIIMEYNAIVGKIPGMANMINIVYNYYGQ